MKKLLALILVVVLALSLVACGGDSGAGDTNTPSGGNGDTTSTDTPSGGGEDSVPSMTKEEMLTNATLLDLSELGAAFEENKIRAEETYIGNSFKTLCFVDKIEGDYFEYYAGDLTIIRVYASKDELKELNTKEGVNIVGTIDSIEMESGQDAIGMPLEWKVIKMENAYCLDKTIYGVFMVNKFDFGGNGETVCVANPVQMLNGGIIDTHEIYRITLDLETLSTLNPEDFIFVSGIISRRDEAFVDQHTNVFELNSVNLIAKDKDEISEYIEQMDVELYK